MTLLPVNWLHPPSKWFHLRHHLGLRRASLCLFGSAKVQGWSSGRNFQLLGQFEGHSHRSHYPQKSESCRETSSHRKENSGLPQRQKGKWVGPEGSARRHFHTKCFPPCDRGTQREVSVPCSCVCPVHTSWFLGSRSMGCGSPLTIECPHCLTPCPTGLCQADLLFMLV